MVIFIAKTTFLICSPDMIFSSKFIAKDLVDQLGGQEIGRLVLVIRAELDHIAAHQVAYPANFFQKLQGLVPVQSARFRRAGGRHDGRVEDVEVEGEIDLGLQQSEHLVDPIHRVEDFLSVKNLLLVQVLQFGGIQTADSYRNDVAVQFRDAAQGAGVAEFVILEFVAAGGG